MKKRKSPPMCKPSVTIDELVDSYFPPDTPPSLRAAMFEMVYAARQIADRHGVCAACLANVLADLINTALEAGKIEHEPSAEDTVNETVPQGVTIQ